MPNSKLRFPRLLWFACLLALPAGLFGQALPPSLFAGLRWRSIGPYRGGRITTVAGVPGDPAVYYIGTPGGGVWKTSDAGMTWRPIFDAEHIASIGALAVAPSAPGTIYVATGEQTPGKGIYRSGDGGRTWIHLGLRHSVAITSLLIDPRHPNHLYAGVAGNLFHPGGERGVYESRDGGRSWKQVLYRDPYSGVADMAWDPAHPKVILATLEEYYRPLPGSKPPQPFLTWKAFNQAMPSAIYKTTNAGKKWKIVDAGLPAQGLGRIGVAIAPGAGGRRCFAIVAQGLFRSDDGARHWRQITHDPRVKGNGYFSRVFVNPSRPDEIYVMQTSMYRSTDGGRHFISFKGAPGGDDNHVLWIAPDDPRRMILGSDQGATITFNGGRTWSSWYNQPTGQFYHVSTDRRFPYRVYGAQQDSGTAMVLSRSDYGEITFRDWMPVGGFEYCFIAPDPVNPRYVFSGGWYGSLLRFDRKTGQVVHIFERGQGYRSAWAPAIVFSPRDPRLLYMGTQYLMATRGGSLALGRRWQTLSPDLAVRPLPPAAQPPPAKPAATPSPATPAAAQKPKKPRLSRGFILSIAPSRIDANLIWVGSSNGLIHLTRDGGKTWTDVSPPGLNRFQAIETLAASATDPAAAYAAVSDDSVFSGSFDSRPNLYRTHDYGRTWTRIVNGLPPGRPALALAQDPLKPSLLFAGTQTGVWVSFNDGDDWQSLQLNLPTAQVTGLTVHGNDLVVSTFGRGFWILDDINPLRQFSAATAAHSALLRPETAVRVRWDNYQDTPLPPEIPAGVNPPNGAILDYVLRAAPHTPVTLAIYDSAGYLVRSFSSVLPPQRRPLLANVPSYWIAPRARLSAHAGLNRFTWNLHYPRPRVLRYGYFGEHLDYFEYTLTNNAIRGKTPRHEPRGPLAVPGLYTVKLSVNGKTYSQPLRLVPDPRIPASLADYQAQFALAERIIAGLAESARQYHAVHPVLQQAQAQWKKLGPAGQAAAAGKALRARIKLLRKLIDGTPKSPGFGTVNRGLARLLSDVESGDAAPVPTMQSALDFNLRGLRQAAAAWKKLQPAGKP